MKYLENPYFYQLSVILTVNINKVESAIAGELSAPFGRTLDVCCGTGNFSGLVRGEYLGIDLNETYISYARKRFKNDPSKTFLVADINNFKFKPKYFDNTFLVSALHHFSDEYLMTILDKINFATKGRIIIMDPARETKSPISSLLIRMDRGSFIRSVDKQLGLVSKKLNIVKHFTFYSRLAHLRIIVCSPKDI